MKYSKGDIVYLAYATEPYEIVDIYGNVYSLVSVNTGHKHQTSEEQTINPRTIYERLEALEQ